MYRRRRRWQSSDLTYARYENLFKGGFALIDLEAITITGESRGRKNQLEIMPKNAAAIAKFVRTLKAINPKALFVFQLTHAGELSNPAFSRRVTVKNLPGYEGDLLSDEEVDRIMDEFVLASQIAHDAGADGIDMKFCHAISAIRFCVLTTTASGSTAGVGATVPGSPTTSTSAFRRQSTIRTSSSDPRCRCGRASRAASALPRRILR